MHFCFGSFSFENFRYLLSLKNYTFLGTGLSKMVKSCHCHLFLTMVWETVRKRVVSDLLEQSCHLIHRLLAAKGWRVSSGSLPSLFSLMEKEKIRRLFKLQSIFRMLESVRNNILKHRFTLLLKAYHDFKFYPRPREWLEGLICVLKHLSGVAIFN